MRKFKLDRKRLVLVYLFVCYFVLQDNEVFAQVYSLNDCMRYAVEHNQSVKKQEYTNNTYKQDRIESVASLFPTIYGGTSGTLNYGRSIDPATNTYTTTGNFGNYYYISSEMPIFAGFTYLNSVRISKTMELMGLSTLDKVKDELALNTMQAYFDVVYCFSEVNIAEEQLATSRQTFFKSKKLFELGLKSEADLAQIESQVASDELLLVQQQNKYNLSLLALKQKMNYPIEDSLLIDVNIDYLNVAKESDSLKLYDVLDYAMSHNPKIIESDLNVRKNKLNYYYYLGKYSPSISIGGGYSTNYYKNLKSHDLTEPFRNQFKDNRGHYFQASLSIPIFNGLSRRASVHKAKNSLKIAQEENSEVVRALQTEIAQVMMEMNGFDKEYEQATRKVEAAELSHNASLKRYDMGSLGPIELQTSANQLHQAKSQQLNAKLQYIIRTKLVNYYNGEPLVEE